MSRTLTAVFQTILLLTIFLGCIEGFHWCPWSPCSATCGEGRQRRYKICGNILDNSYDGRQFEIKQCFKKFCPSYLSWPRMHFSGSLVADVPTVNNVRCNYENKYFSPTKDTTNFGDIINITSSPKHFKFRRANWNPLGTGHVYFYNTTIKSICTSAGVSTTLGGAVGSEVTELTHGRMADIDPDWQTSTQIWGMTVSIPAVLQGDMIPASVHTVNARMNSTTMYALNRDLKKGYIYSGLSVYKTKLVNVTWISDYYKTMFKSASLLSFTFAYDLFDQYSFEGRISGTIGLTSNDDAVELFAGRTMSSISSSDSKYPFYFHETEKVMVIDLSSHFKAGKNGLFDLNYGHLDLTIIVKTKEYCRLKRSYKLCMLKHGTKSSWHFALTKNGTISKLIGNNSKWYLTYGGVLEVNLNHLQNIHIRLLKQSRLVMLKKEYGLSATVMSEHIHGINTGVASTSALRLNPKDTASFSAFASQYGKPAKDMTMSLRIAKQYESFLHCFLPSKCNRSLSTPADAIGIFPKTCTPGKDGLCHFKIHAAKDPGHVRGCQLDGQIYPLQIWSNFNHNGQATRYMTGATQLTHANTHLSLILTMVVKMYNQFEVHKCPTWYDIKDIFQQYHNLYPAMVRNGIINLMSYDDVRKKSKMLQVSMFETDISSPRYMPTTRDLSRSKMQLIKNWMECGMKKGPTKPKPLQCNKETINKQINNTRLLLQKAIILELSTIPPYFTAWLSLKTQLGRNLEVAKILKVIYKEEMLHMTLVSNILNAIGGKVNMSSLSLLPQYPTALEFGDFFEIMPGKIVTIEPMSIDLVQDVFSAIEEPANEVERKLIANIAKLWELLPVHNNTDDSVTTTMNHFIKSNSQTNHSADKILTWSNLQSVSSQTLEAIAGVKMLTISSFYTKIAVQLAFMESCTKSLYSNANIGDVVPSIFIGDPRKQINQSYWYGEENIDDDNIRVVNFKSKEFPFAVTNLKSALEAIVEVVYQGEGGSSCSPFVMMLQNNEYSHYYRFQEIVQGRKLIKVEQPPYWHADKCLNMTGQFECPQLKQAGMDYCYLGKQIHFDKDGVWPLISNPKPHMYAKGTKAHRLDHEFNKIYSRLLICLENAFNGSPDKLKTCMVDMYSLTITGKKMMKTPIGRKGDSSTVEIGQYGHNASPTWQFIRSHTSLAGLPVIT